MILDNISRLSAYRGADALRGIPAVSYFLAHTEISSLKAGKYPIGAGITVAVNRYVPKPMTKYEAHRNFIDLQYMVNGDETMLSSDIADAENPTEYNPSKDVLFFDSSARAVSLPVHNGDFALFFPQDVHAPGIANEKTNGEILKLVFKLPTPEYEQTAHLTQLMEQIGMPEAVQTAGFSAAEAMAAQGTLSDIEAKVFARQPVEEDLQALAGACGISVPLCSLTAYMIFAKSAFYRYLEAGLSPEVFFASMRDFTIWEKVCERKTGAAGLQECSWLAMTLRGEVIRFGRLQFQPAFYRGPAIDFHGVTLKNTTPVIHIHIPEDGRLEREQCLDAYRRAQAFFADRFADGNVLFACHSWLLYPAHRTILPETSNILSFMNDFAIVSSREFRVRPSELWRIFGFVADDTAVEALPQNTGLQRVYARHLAETGCWGDGNGVFFFDGTTFRK